MTRRAARRKLEADPGRVVRIDDNVTFLNPIDPDEEDPAALFAEYLPKYRRRFVRLSISLVDRFAHFRDVDRALSIHKAITEVLGRARNNAELHEAGSLMIRFMMMAGPKATPSVKGCWPWLAEADATYAEWERAAAEAAAEQPGCQ